MGRETEATMKTLTDKERDAMGRIRAAITVQSRRLVADGHTNPTQWLFLTTAVQVHGIKLGLIRSMIRKGFLQEQPSGGFGPQIKPTNPE